MATRAVVNQRALGQFIRTPGPQGALDDTATSIAEAIKDEAPVNSGNYQDSIRWRRFPMSRRVFSTDIAAHIIEWAGMKAAGPEKRAPYGPGGGAPIAYAPFRRAIRRLRLVLVPSERPGAPE